MSKVEVGDQVLTGNGEYQTIYSIDHRHQTKLTEFVQIYYADGEPPLEMTPHHMVFLQEKPYPVPARHIRIGDKLRFLQQCYDCGSSSLRCLDVVRVSSIVRRGLYNPLTSDGTIVVNGGIVASTYSALIGDQTSWIKIAGYNVMTQQHFFSAALKLYRNTCIGISLDLCKSNKEKVFVSQVAHRWYNRWSKHDDNRVQQTVCILLVACFLCLSNFFLSRHFLILACVSFVLLPSISNWRRQKKTRKLAVRDSH